MKESSGSARNVQITEVHKSFGDVAVLTAISLDVAPGESLALLGPSGCGKTTLLRLIAGLERPDAGRIEIGETEMVAETTWVPPEKRNVGMVFQDWALFPHFTVERNVAYGLSRTDRRGERAAEALAMVGMADFGSRMPDTLSGGQQQRVALARAIAPEPSVLLLDEPFSNLDAALRVEIRSEVGRLVDELGITAIFVTHDQEEAFVLGDRVAVMHDGVIEQVATPKELYQRPVNPWTASFVGEVNFVAGVADGTNAETEIGAVTLASQHTGAVEILMRPEDLALAPSGTGTVTDVTFLGHDLLVHVRLASGTDVQARTSPHDPFVLGDFVSVCYDGPPATAFA